MATQMREWDGGIPIIAPDGVATPFPAIQKSHNVRGGVGLEGGLGQGGGAQDDLRSNNTQYGNNSSELCSRNKPCVAVSAGTGGCALWWGA